MRSIEPIEKSHVILPVKFNRHKEVDLRKIIDKMTGKVLARVHLCCPVDQGMTVIKEITKVEKPYGDFDLGLIV